MNFEPSSKAITNERGFIFDAHSGFAKEFNEIKKYKKHKLKLSLVYNPDKNPKEYLLYKNNEVVGIYTKIEDICIKADIYCWLGEKELKS